MVFESRSLPIPSVRGFFCLGILCLLIELCIYTCTCPMLRFFMPQLERFPFNSKMQSSTLAAARLTLSSPVYYSHRPNWPLASWFYFLGHAIGVNSKPSSKAYQMRLTSAERSVLTLVLHMKREADEEHSEKLTFTQGRTCLVAPPPSSFASFPFHFITLRPFSIFFL
jgi:hypothetical protein